MRDNLYELTEQDRKDLDIIRRIRAGKSLKVVTGAYTIVNEAWRKEHPWVLPGYIVRCRECTRFEPCGDGTSGICAWHGGTRDAADYCSDGERRESE